MKLLRTIILLLSVAVPSVAWSTAQATDKLVVGKDTLNLTCNPLESYFDDQHPRPENLFTLNSSACWRGYIAYFRLYSDSLYLTGIKTGRGYDALCFLPLDTIFGDKVTSRGVFADWVTGCLTGDSGKLIEYVHMGYMSTYEFEFVYRFRSGVMKKKKELSNSKSFLPCRSDYDGANTGAGGYSLLINYIESQINYSRLGPEDLDRRVNLVVKEVNGKGRIKKIELDQTLTKPLRAAVRRAVKKVPRFNVLYAHGKQVKDRQWILPLHIYGSEAERVKHGIFNGPDNGEYSKNKMMRGEDYVGNLEHLVWAYLQDYHQWKHIIADTSADGRKYKDYFCQLYGDTALYQHHYFLTLGDSALKYSYEYWDLTGDHEQLYPQIVALEQELGRPHNAKVVEEKNEPFVYFVTPQDFGPTLIADSEHVDRRCRQVSYHLRGFGEGDLHESLPSGVVEEWRLLLLQRSSALKKMSPVMIKVLYDGEKATLCWREAMETTWNIYPGLDHFRHGIEHQGERTLTAEEWEQLQHLASTAGMDTLHLDNDYFTSPPAVYHVEHRTKETYHAINDYNHPYHTRDEGEIDPRFRTFCKYITTLVTDFEIPFDIDDIR